MMRSCIYEGRVAHIRSRPIKHKFSYRLFMLYLDLSELPELFRERWFWSIEKANLANFRRSDYLGPSSLTLEEAVRERVRNAQGFRPAGPIRMLTHLRYFGYVFNPVSFYYCFNEEDDRLETIVAEITNTPWRERHTYILDRSESEGDSDELRFRFAKSFHVSPFIGMNQSYDWTFGKPEESLHVHMTNTQEGERVFDADLQLSRKKIAGSSLSRVLFTYPPMTMKVTAGIYWQALRLRLKGVDFYTHPKKIQTPNGGSEG